MKVFVSYSWKQGTRVWERLVPVLRAAGIEVLIDRERFTAGKDVASQMHATQDQADKHLLCLSADYHMSKACQHEMRRAVELDPQFANGSVIPLRFDGAPLPAALSAKRLTTPNPLWISFTDDTAPVSWEELLRALDVSIGMCPTRWLASRDRMIDHLQRQESVYLLLGTPQVRWRPVIDHLRREHFTALARVDLDHGRTVTRSGFLNEILTKLGIAAPVRPAPEDLGDFHDRIEALRSPALVSLIHFENVRGRDYGVDLFRSIRNLVNAQPRRLVLLVTARTALETLLPSGHPMSEIEFSKVDLP